MAVVDLSAIDPNIDAGIARNIYEAMNDGIDNNVIITFGNRLQFLDTNGDNVEIYVSGTSLVIPATSSSTRADTVAFYFGSDSDINLVFDGTKMTSLTPVADDVVWEWGDGTESFDQKFFFETASNYVYFDASADQVYFEAVDLRMNDDDILAFGDSDDVQIRWDGTDLDVLALADDQVIKFGNGTNSFDVWIYGNTANDNIIFDASGNILNLDGVDLQMEDDDVLSFGDSKDVTIAWAAGGGLNILAAADNSVITFGATGNSFDVIWNLSTSAKTITIDASEDTMTLDDVDLYLGDNDNISFGDSQDMVLQYTTDLTLTAAADDDVFSIGNGTESIDVKWFGETASNIVLFDASADQVIFEQVDLRLNDDDKLLLGDSSDVEVYWTTAGGLKIAAAADDSVIEFGISAATQKSFDIKVYGNASNGVDFVLFDAGASAMSFNGAYSLSLGRHTWAKIQNKTADYVVTAADSGTFFTNTGDGDDIQYTLPALAAGLTYIFTQQTDNELKILSPEGNNIVAFNDLTATSVTFTDAGQQIGAWIQVVCDGTSWYFIASGGGTGSEYTITVA